MKNQFVLLKDIASVKSGVTYIQQDKNGLEYKLIQLKDINDEGVLSYNLDEIHARNITYNQLIQFNDLIFKAKSSQNVTGILKEKGNYIATSQFFVISLRKNPNILPEYIWWYLNQDTSKKYFEKMASGSSTIIVKKPDIESLRIQIPTIEQQIKIVSIYDIWLKEKNLYKKKIEEKNRYINSVLHNILYSNLKVNNED